MAIVNCMGSLYRMPQEQFVMDMIKLLLGFTCNVFLIILLKLAITDG